MQGGPVPNRTPAAPRFLFLLNRVLRVKRFIAHICASTEPLQFSRYPLRIDAAALCGCGCSVRKCLPRLPPASSVFVSSIDFDSTNVSGDTSMSVMGIRRTEQPQGAVNASSTRTTRIEHGATAHAPTRASPVRNVFGAMRQRAAQATTNIRYLARKIGTSPGSPERYYAKLDRWAAQGSPSDGNRRAAVRIITEWLESARPEGELDLSSLNLRSLPKLPSQVQSLNVSGNPLGVLGELPADLRKLQANQAGLYMAAQLPPGLASLNLSGNRFIASPVLPDGLEELDLSNNLLNAVPMDLPASLQVLRLGNNRINGSVPPLPPALRELDLSNTLLMSLGDALPSQLAILHAHNNGLTVLPDPLPPGLHFLGVARNQLTACPAHFPQGMIAADLRDNHIDAVPESATTALQNACSVNLRGNRLPPAERERLEQMMRGAGYAGPWFNLSSAPTQPAWRAQTAAPSPATPRHLAEAAAFWLDGESSHVGARWAAFAPEAGAPAFARFLDRLREPASNNPGLQERIAAWLGDLEQRPDLRRNTFLMAEEATQSCDDSILLLYNGMQDARLTDDIEKGAYDDRIEDLVEQCRGSFRLSELAKIAKEKVSNTPGVDEIEVYLAFQVQLRDALKLPTDVSSMRFFRCADLTEAELKQAEREVKKAESDIFTRYLANECGPWRQALGRLDPARYEQAETDLYAALEEAFDARIDAALTPSALQNDADARRTQGVQVTADLNEVIYGKAARDFLAERGLVHVLDPVS
ncbi:hypothetical protein E4K72_13295 [Oxalobacteraceae bacterium OM1]|nr:hypothetical protein E4K72_13295 [Oxalobacteraceae bacterium OM1]